MKFLLLILTLYSLQGLFAQADLKTIKKEIPINGIKEISLIEGTDILYQFKSKKEDGIWDDDKKQIIAKGVEKIAFFKFDSSWISISAGTKHILYNWATNGTKLTSKDEFKIFPSTRSDLLILVNSEFFGVFAQHRSEFFIMRKNAETDAEFYAESDTLSWGEEATRSLIYNGETKSFYLDQYLGDGVTGYWSVYLLDDYIVEKASEWSKVLRVINPTTGEVPFEGAGYIKKWKDGYCVVDYNSFSIMDGNFKVVIDAIHESEFGNDEFEKLIGNGIISSKHVDDGIYVVENNNGTFLYDVGKLEKITTDYDNIYLAGQDVLTRGYYMFLVDQDKVGYHHTNGFHLEPRYESVQLREFEDGSFGIKADSELYTFTREKYFSYYAKYSDTLQWREALENSSSVYHHVTFVNDKYLIVSLRKSDPDTHDSGFYTATNYQDGSGVYDLKNERWILKNYHYINPYKGYYIATTVGSIYRNWLKAEIYDADFNVINKDQYSSPLIYKGKLILKDSNYDLIQYDIKNQKKLKTLGDSESPYSDFMFYNGYVFMGSANYEDNRKENRNGFEILSVMTPDFKIIPHQGMGFYEFLGDGLIAMGKFVEERNYGRDWNGYPKAPEQMAVIDIFTGKIISNRWYKEIRAYDGNVYLEWIENDKSVYKDVPLEELRAFLSK